MSRSRTVGAEALIAPLYVLAFLLVFTPAMDFVTSVVPARPGDLEWRFASVGLLSGFLLTPMLGFALALGVAQWSGHLRFQRVLSVSGLVVAGLAAALFVFFLLDVLQLRNAVQAEAVEAFDAAATKAAVKHLSFLVVLSFLAWRGVRSSRWSVPEGRRTQAAVVVGG